MNGRIGQGRETADDEPVSETVLPRWTRWLRMLRLSSGIVLFIFLTMHLLNHAIGVFGLAALDTVQTLRWSLWINPIGIGLLYGALFVHVVLVLAKTLLRRSFRMPADEAAQLVLGLLIPLLLTPHLVHTRISSRLFGTAAFYEEVLRGLWPSMAVVQIILILVAWSHGALGIALAFRHHEWFRRFRMLAFALAVAIPTLAIGGFIAGAREVTAVPAPPPDQATLERRASLSMVQMSIWSGLGGIALLMALWIKYGYIRRRVGSKIVIHYRGRGPVRVPMGTSILEASRIHDIPHPSVCRGRGRCSTCSVQILSNPADLPEASELERRTLDRVGAQPNVRLACQLRPSSAVRLRILLPVLGRADNPESADEVERWAVERVATVLSLDLRAFNVLVESRLPYELAALVNRFADEMRQAIENHGGAVSTFYGDGMIAVFDDPRHIRQSALNALAAARDMDRVLLQINREMGSALPIPVRAGIGIHTERVTMARIGKSDQSSELMVFGAGVNISQGLQLATKSVLADCLCSEATAKIARLDLTGIDLQDIPIDGLEAPMRAVPITDWDLLRKRKKSAAEAETAETESTV